MFTKKKIFWAILVILIFILVFWLSFYVIKYRNAVQASSGFPYQIGLTDVIITKCVTAGTPPTCVGAGTPPDPIATPLCNTKLPAVCTVYSVVSGKPAGGMGSNALFLNTAITATGLTPGGQLIAGGISAVLMDNGVLASTGGVFYALAGKINQAIDYALALFD